MDGGLDAGCADFDASGLDACGIDYDGAADVDISSFAFDGGDVDVTAAEVLGESAGDMHSADYTETSVAYGNQSRVRSVSSDQPRNVAVHVVGHSRLDVVSAFERFAQAEGLVRIPWIRVGGRDIDQEHDKLLPMPIRRKGQKASGWYRGATGTTTVSRRYYCVGVRNIPVVGELVYDRCARVFVEVTSYTWDFSETRDSESLVVMKVISLPSYCQHARRYLFQANPLSVLNKRVEEVRKNVFRILKLANPGKRCAERRRKALKGIFPRVEVPAMCTANGAVERLYGQGVVLFPA